MAYANDPYKKALEELAAKNTADIATAQAGAGSQGQQSYVNWMLQKRGLNEALAQQGITGGASESAILGADVGYQRQKNTIAQNLQSNLNTLAQNYAANRTALETQSAAWQEAKQQQEEQRFANTITGYDTVAKVDNAIEAARTAGETWKIPYLNAQRAALVEQAKAIAEAESSRSSSSSSTPSTSSTDTYASAMNSLAAAGGLSGTQYGMTPTNYPTRPLTYSNRPTTRNQYYR